jgi:hypothetical protein
LEHTVFSGMKQNEQVRLRGVGVGVVDARLPQLPARLPFLVVPCEVCKIWTR